MTKTLPVVVALFKELADSDILFQGVKSHPVFMEPCAVSHEQFDAFEDSLAQEDLRLFGSDLRSVYSRLLDSGFFDGYLGLHFDVGRVTSYVTVVSHANYVFDMDFARALCPQQFARCYTDRIEQVNSGDWLAKTRAQEKTLYSFAFRRSWKRRGATLSIWKKCGVTRGLQILVVRILVSPIQAAHSQIFARDIYLASVRDVRQERHAAGKKCVKDAQSEVCAPAASIYLPVDPAKKLRLS